MIYNFLYKLLESATSIGSKLYLRLKTAIRLIENKYRERPRVRETA